MEGLSCKLSRSFWGVNPVVHFVLGMDSATVRCWDLKRLAEKASHFLQGTKEWEDVLDFSKHFLPIA